MTAGKTSGTAGSDKACSDKACSDKACSDKACSDKACSDKTCSDKTGAVTIHGIRNCDTMKQARAWLDARGVAYAFHDYKAAGIERAVLEGWVKVVGWEPLLNRAGTTFRALPDDRKQALDAAKAIGLMLAQPSMIKRPVLALGDRLLVGFKPEHYEAAFARR